MSKEKEVTLIVLCHGLWGSKSHMGYIEKALEEKYGDAVSILNASVNEGKYTYDGVDICGDRLAEEVEATVVRLGKNGKQVKKISMIGYSLGGLITRYAIGTLGQRGFFNTIQPDYFITFATPHMGVLSPVKTVFSRAFNFVTGKLVSRSGEQLVLIDTRDEETGMSLFEVLSHPDYPYFKYLAKFNVRRTYANISNDRTVPYWSSGLETSDFFYKSKGKLDITTDQEYKTVVTGFDTRVKGQKNQIDKPKEKKPLKPKLIQYAIYCLFPILPVWMIFVFTVLSTQGLISRYRVSKILSKQKSLVENMDSETTLGERRGSHMSGEFLTGVLDAVNLPSQDKVQETSSSTQENNDDSKNVNHFKVSPSKSVEKNAKPLPFDEKTLLICKNLNLLEWERVWIYIRTFNAHGAIICRQKIYRSDGGISTIKHFLDTTQFT